ncbi:hypothetical protein ACX0GZ_04640 [Sphingomonas aestuarii]
MVEHQNSDYIGIPPALATIEKLVGEAQLATFRAYAVAHAAWDLTDKIDVAKDDVPILGRLDSLSDASCRLIKDIQEELGAIEDTIMAYRREAQRG